MPLIPNQHKDAFTRQFVRELLVDGESHGHQLEDLIDVDAFPEMGRAVAELAAAQDPADFFRAATTLRASLEEAAATLAAGAFDVLQNDAQAAFVHAQLEGRPQPYLA